MGMLRFVSKSGYLDYRKREQVLDEFSEGIKGITEWKDSSGNYITNENLDGRYYSQEKSSLEMDDTLRGVLIKNLYSMDIKDEILREILGKENTSFKPGDILGIMGSIGSGKSLLMMHFVAISILPEEMGGHGQKVYYIDTDSGFSIEVFTEKHLIPIIEKKIVNQDFYFQLVQENCKTNTNKILEQDFSKVKMRDEQVIINQVIKKSLSNLNVIFVNDLLDLLCVLKQMISNSSIGYFNNDNDFQADKDINNDYDSNNHHNNNNKAKLLVIDSINFWNADLSSFITNDYHEKITNKYHILGYFTNKNTIFNSIFSLIRQIVQFHGFIGMLSFCEEPIIQFTYNNGINSNNNGINNINNNINSNNNINGSSNDKFKNNFTEELVEVDNLFQSKNIEVDDHKRNDKLILKFPKIIHTKIFPNFLSKILKIEDFQSITNIIWIVKSSYPICDQIHNYPNSCIIPTYFSCISVNNLQKSYLAFNDFHGLVLV